MDPWVFPGYTIPPPFNQQPHAYMYGNTSTLDTYAINESANGVPSAQSIGDEPGAHHLPNSPQDAASLSDAEFPTTLMGPPVKRRKKKAPTLRAKDWEPYEARIIELHDEQDLPLSKVKTMIEQEFGFTAELRQYRTRISQWGKDKNFKPQEMSAIVKKRQKRKLVEVDKREQVFTVRGRNVEPHKIDRWMARNEVSQTSLYAPSPEALSSTAATSPVPFLRKVAHAQSTTFTGQSPAPVNQHPATRASASYSSVSNPGSDEQLPCRYRQHDEERIREELSTAEISLGINHSQTLKLRIALGYVLISQGRYKSAEETARRVIGDYQRHKDNGALVIDATELLVHVLRYQGSSHQAIKLAESLIESKKATFGRKHLSTLMSMEALSWQSTIKAMDRVADVYCFQKRWKDAQELLVLIVELSMLLVGEEHEDTLAYQRKLAEIYRKQGQLKEAEDLGERVLVAMKKVYGEQHPQTLHSMSLMVETYMGQERFQEAEDLGVQLLMARKRVLGEQHRRTFESVAFLIRIYIDQGNLTEAGDLGTPTLVAMKEVLGDDHPHTLRVADLMGQIRKAQEES
ncbi:hypothetical protein ACHAP8_009541 [Fusarium lateritium]